MASGRLRSPAARGRGLKQLCDPRLNLQRQSPAARGRGLKPPGPAVRRPKPRVARRARAWIETESAGATQRIN
jgi:hypothetical protein